MICTTANDGHAFPSAPAPYEVELEGGSQGRVGLERGARRSAGRASRRCATLAPMATPEEHWNAVYRAKSADRVSWYQAEASTSLDLVRACGLAPDGPIVDVGAGASRLVDGLLAAGHSDVTLLDLSAEALAVTRARLGDEPRVREVVADVTTWSPTRRYALWHDRAVFHFLVLPEQRSGYVRALGAALAPKAHAVIATFALDGPERCSDLPVQRYSAELLAAELAPMLDLVESRHIIHTTPWGSTQSFVFGRFQRR